MPPHLSRKSTSMPLTQRDLKPHVGAVIRLIPVDPKCDRPVEGKLEEVNPGRATVKMTGGLHLDPSRYKEVKVVKTAKQIAEELRRQKDLHAKLRS